MKVPSVSAWQDGFHGDERARGPSLSAVRLAAFSPQAG